ncbi:MAG: transporter substrate-binding domain-containing protein [Coleofasciculus sp. G1-WW12-02]|uniref:transporter substrate-binding domain-containing protein n=1 Tax=Coleofasciculus sp. G1-WW12-02 TaxID=3068483 RepID=UPI0032F99FF7
MIAQRFFNVGVALGLMGVAVVQPPSAYPAELAEIEQRGQLIVAVKDNVRPLGFRDATGTLQGLEIDIARRLAKELLGSPEAVVLQPVTNRDRLSVVFEDRVDIAIARVTVTDSRARLVDFSIPYYLDGAGIITKDASINLLSDLDNQTIAVLKGSSTIAVIKYALPNAQLVGVDSYQEARALIEAGEANAFCADQSVLTGWVQQYPDYRLLPYRLSGAALAVVMPKGLQYTALRQQVNQAIARWHAEGWLAERAAAWGLP